MKSWRTVRASYPGCASYPEVPHSQEDFSLSFYLGEKWLTTFKEAEDGTWGHNKLMVWQDQQCNFERVVQPKLINIVYQYYA